MRIKCGEDWQAAMLLEKVAPETLGEQTIVVGHDGTVIECRPDSAAVRQWRFRPTKLDGRPVEVQTTVRMEL